jgi:hypothetical protein
MNGRIIRQPKPDTRHRCLPPVARDRGLPRPSEPDGTVWECDCGRQWKARTLNDDHGSRVWRRKRLRVRAALDKGDNKPEQCRQCIELGQSLYASGVNKINGEYMIEQAHAEHRRDNKERQP